VTKAKLELLLVSGRHLAFWAKEAPSKVDMWPLKSLPRKTWV